MFDWKAFLDKHGVEWSETDSNVVRGNIGIQCPFCGRADTSFHMGINPETGAYNCWRDSTHRGKKPYYLIQKIANLTRPLAIALYEGDQYATKVELDQLATSLSGAKPKLTLPEQEFTRHEFLLQSGEESSQRFFRYIESRGFIPPAEVAEYYKLRGAVSGNFAYRLIFPFYIKGKLVGWTGRAIVESRLRYKAHPSGEGIGKNVIFNYDNCSAGGELLLVCEGTVDAIKLDHYGMALGVRAVALLGLNFTAGKAKLLLELSKGFKKSAIVLDSSALAQALEGQRILCAAEFGVYQIPDAIKDPGDMTKKEVREFLNQCLSSQ